MATFRENIKNLFGSGSNDLRNVYVELRSDNKINRVVITDADKLSGRYSFDDFIKDTIKSTWSKPFIPDNVLIKGENIRRSDIPQSNEFFGKNNNNGLRFIISLMMNPEYTVSLRRAVYLNRWQRDISTKNLENLTDNESYRGFAEHQEALESISRGRPARMSLTAVELDRGCLIFSRSLPGQQGLQLFLQYMADNFHQPANDGLRTLKIYEFASDRKELIVLADKCYRGAGFNLGSGQFEFESAMSRQKDLLPSSINPAVQFDMRPSIDSLDRFVTENMLGLSGHNYDIMTLQSITEEGYHPMAVGNSFSYLKEFSKIDRELKHVEDAKGLSAFFPYEQQYKLVQDDAKLKARYLLDNMVRVRKDLSDESMIQKIGDNRNLSGKQKSSLTESIRNEKRPGNHRSRKRNRKPRN